MRTLRSQIPSVGLRKFVATSTRTRAHKHSTKHSKPPHRERLFWPFLQAVGRQGYLFQKHEGKPCSGPNAYIGVPEPTGPEPDELPRRNCRVQSDGQPTV